MRPTLPLACLAIAAPAALLAQASADPPTTPFVRVEIDGALNLRPEPSTQADRITRFADGSLLRNLGCGTYEARAWCEVETVLGGVAGWAAAEFLAPYAGADPAALMTPNVPADIVADAAYGRLAGAIASASIIDYRLRVAAGGLLTVEPVEQPDGTIVLLFDPEGRILAELEPADAAAVLEFGEGADVLLRLVETLGVGGDYAVNLRLD